MRNFIIILFIFFLIFIIVSIFWATNQMFLFLAIFLGFLIAFICLGYYLGPILGIIIGLLFIASPFLLEYLGYRFYLPFFKESTITGLEVTQIGNLISTDTLFSIFTIPLLFMTSLFFAFKIKIFTNVKTYHKIFLTVIMSLLVAANFLNITSEQAIFNDFIKWLAIALVISALMSYIFYFRLDTDRIFKEIPIILFLTIFITRSLKPINEFNLFIGIILVIIYLILLYNEYKLQKISHELEHLT